MSRGVDRGLESRLWLLTWVLLAGCTFFQLPGKKALDLGSQEQSDLSWSGSDDGRRRAHYGLREMRESESLKLEAVTDAVCENGADLGADRIPAVRFLHFSDAQIRDERTYEGSPTDLLTLNLLDPFVDVTVRRPVVEQNDALVFASFVFASDDRPLDFKIHTGDLLDISLVTELMEAMAVLSETAGEDPPFRAVAGNHDGLTFGNIADLRSDTRGLGVNKGEFVVAHLMTEAAARRPDAAGTSAAVASSRNPGFGFGWNEHVQHLCGCKHLAGDGIERRFCKEVVEARSRVQDAKPSRRPISYRGQIDFSGTADRSDLRLGYYSWDSDLPQPVGASGIKGFRYVVLDTRDSFGADGVIDDVQLGWLYDRLSEADEQKRAVVVFAHHSVDDVQGSTACSTLWGRHSEGCALRRMVTEFHNVVAYFHGHGHHNGERLSSDGRLLQIETGSTADFPQVGRIVELYAPESGGSSEMIVAWEFVRPTEKENLDLDADLAASRKDAEKEYRAGRFLSTSVPVRRALGPLLMNPFEQEPHWQGWKAWRRENLKSCRVARRISFGDVPALAELAGPGRAARIRRLRDELAEAYVQPGGTCSGDG